MEIVVTTGDIRRHNQETKTWTCGWCDDVSAVGGGFCEAVRWRADGADVPRVDGRQRKWFQLGVRHVLLPGLSTLPDLGTDLVRASSNDSATAPRSHCKGNLYINQCRRAWVLWSGGLNPWKYVGGVRICFTPPKNVTVFHSKLLLDNCKFHIIKDERLVLKVEGRTNFSRRLKQFDVLTWLTLTTIFYATEPDIKVRRFLWFKPICYAGRPVCSTQRQPSRAPSPLLSFTALSSDTNCKHEWVSEWSKVKVITWRRQFNPCFPITGQSSADIGSSNENLNFVDNNTLQRIT